MEDPDLILLLKRPVVSYCTVATGVSRRYNGPGPNKRQWVIQRGDGSRWTTSDYYTEEVARKRWSGKPHAVSGRTNTALYPEPSAMIMWGGGECPCLGSTVNYRMREGRHDSHTDEAHKLRWAHTGGGGDIVAYRICP